MRSRDSVGKTLMLVLALAAATADAQAPEPQTIVDALHDLSQQAAVIFSGHVIAVRRIEGANGTVGVVETDFAVEDSVRGISGATYTLRQWAGLWAGGVSPFRVGQHYLMFFYAPGPSGLSSPVGGMDGAIPFRGNTTRVVDLRWIGSRVAHPIAYRPGSLPHEAFLPIDLHSTTVTTPTEAAESLTGESTSYAATLAILRSWEGSDHAGQ